LPSRHRATVGGFDRRLGLTLVWERTTIEHLFPLGAGLS
jgi:hypothetical protein